ncbi:MAG: hypothetical protein GC160_10650 [Acidobacteria bacterium]|nr:hypothetical protein [Acidobacteriota bacterium]
MPLSATLTHIQSLGGAVACLSTAAFLGCCTAPIVALPEGTTPVERSLFRFGLGVVALSGLVFALCAVRAATSGAFLLLWAISGLLALPRLEEWARSFERPSLTRSNAVYAAVGLAYAGLYATYALGPPTASDAVTYHLGLVRQYALHQGFVGDTRSIYAFLSQGMEMLFLVAYSIGGESGPQLVHLALLVTTAPVCIAFARRAGRPLAGPFAAGLYGTAPLVGLVAVSAYNDAALALFAFLTFYWYIVWAETAPARGLAGGGALAGFCFAVKYTGGFVGCVWVACVAARTWGSTGSARRTLGCSFAAAAGAALVAAPWLVKNWLVVGNPMAPFFSRLFPNPFVGPVWEWQYADGLRLATHLGRGINVASIPYELAVGGAFNGVFGIGLFLAPVALLGWRVPFVRPLLGWSAVLALPWVENCGARFLMPSFLFVSVAVGLSVSRSGRLFRTLGPALLLIQAASSAPSVLREWSPRPIWQLPHAPWKKVLGRRRRGDYLRRWVDRYDVAQDLAAVSDSESRVFSLVPLPEAFLDARVIVSFQSWRNTLFAEALRLPLLEDDWPTRTILLRFPPQEVARIRIVQETSHEWSEWRAYELKARSLGQAVSLSGARATSSANPWLAGALLDGEPYSLWASGSRLRPGMFLEVDLARPTRLDSIEILSPRGQYFLTLSVWIDNGSGSWSRVASDESNEIRESKTGGAPAGVALAAGRALARCGVDLLVVDLEGDGHNDVAEAIDRNPAAYGLAKVRESGSHRIFRVMDGLGDGSEKGFSCPH